MVGDQRAGYITKRTMSQPYLSAVITCLNEEKTIESFMDGLVRALDSLGVNYEVILVDDGSVDRTFPVISGLLQRHPRIQAGLELMKNSGQVAAITAGVCEARGEYVLMMDSDLQLDPADIGLLMAAARSGLIL